MNWPVFGFWFEEGFNFWKVHIINPWELKETICAYDRKNLKSKYLSNKMLYNAVDPF